MPSVAPPFAQLPLDAGEDARLGVLGRTALLDSDPDELFDRYVRVASQIAGTPISLISLVDHDRQWFKAEHGSAIRETPRAWAFCDHAIRTGAFMEVEDALEDARFADNPLVTGATGIRFYGGAPLLVGKGQAIGTLCVIDKEPRRLSAEQRSALVDLAAILAREIDTNHLAEVRADRAAAARAAAIEIEHQMRNMFSKVGAIIDMAAREAASPDELAEAARRRVVALSQANEIALRNDFGLVPLMDIAEASLRLARDKTGLTVTIEGEPVQITPAAASVLAPLLDELAHDADRRAAPAAAALSWRVTDSDLVIEWQEREVAQDGDPFVSSYLRSVAPSALRGTVSVGEDGPSYALSVPLALITSANEG